MPKVRSDSKCEMDCLNKSTEKSKQSEQDELNCVLDARKSKKSCRYKKV